MPFNAEAATGFFRTALLGGSAAGAVDGIDGDSVSDKDLILAMVSNILYIFEVDADSAAAEDSPNVIAFDANGGDKRAVLKAALGGTGDSYFPGNVGIGTIAPDAAFEINHATGDNFRLTYNDADGSAANYVDFQVSSSGDLSITASGGDFDFNGAYATQLQNLPDLVSKEPSYWLDGDNDAIDIPADSKITDLFNNGGSVVLGFCPEDVSATLNRLINKSDGGADGWYVGLRDTGKLTFIAVRAVDNGMWQSPNNSIVQDTHQIIVITNDTADTGDSALMYINGHPQVVTEVSTPTGAYNTDSAEYLRLGSDKSLTHNYSGGVGFAYFFNLALDNDDPVDKAIINGGDVPFKYTGASQTEMVVNGGFETAGGGGADIWADWTEQVTNGALANDVGIVHGGVDSAKITAGASRDTGVYSTITVVPDKRYRFSFWSYGDGTNEGRYIVYDNTNFVAIQALTGSGNTAAAWAKTICEFTVPAECVAVRLYLRCANLDATVVYFDDVSLTQIGCVLQLEQDGIGHNQWIDKSGNELHGTVSGALPTNLPTDHREKYVDLTLTGDSSFTLPKGYQVKSITFKSDGAIGGGIDVGTTNGGGELVAAEAIGGAVTVLATLIDAVTIGGTFTTADDILYVTDADGTGWDGASVEMRVEMERLTVN